MRILFNRSLCKKCPYGDFDPCHYQQHMMRHIQMAGSGPVAVHKCRHYQRIFKKGQLVVVDLYHRRQIPGGRWKWVLAKKNAPGRVIGFGGSKYRIELFEAVWLFRKQGRRPAVSRVGLHLCVHKTAKEIRILDFDAFVPAKDPLSLFNDIGCSYRLN